MDAIIDVSAERVTRKYEQERGKNMANSKVSEIRICRLYVCR